MLKSWKRNNLHLTLFLNGFIGRNHVRAVVMLLFAPCARFFPSNLIRWGKERRRSLMFGRTDKMVDTPGMVCFGEQLIYTDLLCVLWALMQFDTSFKYLHWQRRLPSDTARSGGLDRSDQPDLTAAAPGSRPIRGGFYYFEIFLVFHSEI